MPCCACALFLSISIRDIRGDDPSSPAGIEKREVYCDICCVTRNPPHSCMNCGRTTCHECTKCVCTRDGCIRGHSLCEYCFEEMRGQFPTCCHTLFATFDTCQECYRRKFMYLLPECLPHVEVERGIVEPAADEPGKFIPPKLSGGERNFNTSNTFELFINEEMISRKSARELTSSDTNEGCAWMTNSEGAFANSSCRSGIPAQAATTKSTDADADEGCVGVSNGAGESGTLVNSSRSRMPTKATDVKLSGTNKGCIAMKSNESGTLANSSRSTRMTTKATDVKLSGTNNGCKSVEASAKAAGKSSKKALRVRRRIGAARRQMRPIDQFEEHHDMRCFHCGKKATCGPEATVFPSFCKSHGTICCFVTLRGN